MGSPIHNGVRHKWDFLEVIDRASGEVEAIRLDDANSAASVASAAQAMGTTTSAAWDILLDGGHITTCGFVRRLKKAGAS